MAGRTVDLSTSSKALAAGASGPNVVAGASGANVVTAS